MLTLLTTPTTTAAATLSFAGRTWTVKAGSSLGPGPNSWSAANAYTDAAGALHLHISKESGSTAWQCAEIFLTESLGYGTYSWVVETNVTRLDPYAVLGLFTYEDDAHEIDAEMSRWGNAANPNNADFAVQPSDAKGNLLDYNIPLTVGATLVNYSWAKGSATFTLRERGGIWSTRWNRTGPSVPAATGKEAVHINLWLFRGHAPAAATEVVISDFAWSPLPPPQWLPPLATAAAAPPPVYNIATTCGAVPDNATDATSAIQACLNMAGTTKGIVLVPEGVFQTGTVSIPSGVTLSFAENGWLQGSPHPSAYSSDWDYWHVVQSVNASDVAIIGPGGMSGAGGGIVGALWQMVDRFDPVQRMLVPKPWTGAGGCVGECRPKNIAFIDCQRVTLSGFTLRDSSSWTMLLRRVDNATLSDLVITGPLDWPNGDGCDIESGSNISITRVRISTGDDAIAMRSGNCNTLRTPWPPGKIAPLSHVLISSSTLTSSSAAVKIEALFQDDHGDIDDVRVDNCDIVDSNRGVGIWQRVSGPSGGAISNVIVSNTRIQTRFMYGSGWWGSGEAVTVTTIPENRAQAAQGLRGIRNVTFVNVTASAENGCLFSARDQTVTNPNALSGLSLVNFSLTIGRWSSGPTHAIRDYRPLDADANSPQTIPALVDGLVFEHVPSVTIEGGVVTFLRPAQGYWDGPGGVGVCVNATADSKVSGAGSECSLAR